MTSIIISRDTKDALLAMIKANCEEPVTGGEVYLAQKRHLKKAFSTVNKALQELVIEGKLITRLETADEQTIRSRGKAAQLYWPAANGTKIPARRADVQFPGVRRSDAVGVEYRKARPGRKMKLQTGSPLVKISRPGKAAAVQTGNRIERLEKRVAELETTLASLRKILL